MKSISNADLVARAGEVVMREGSAVQALAAQFDSGLVDVIDVLFNCQGHVLVTGAGTSYAMAQRFAHLLSCSGTPALCISAAQALHGGAGAVREGDVVYVISKGGQSREVNQFVDIARRRGAKIVAQTQDSTSPLAEKSDAILTVRVPETVDPFGMVATGSGCEAFSAAGMWNSALRHIWRKRFLSSASSRARMNLLK